MIGLAATPEVSLADEPVRIRAWGLPPQTAITLRAWVRDEKGDIFHSRAFYQTDTEGKVDLEQSEATGGDFRGIYPMGLFWALKPTTPYRRLIKWDVMGSPFLVHLELYPSVLLVPSEDHLPAVTTVVERWYVAPGVQRLQVRDGRVRGALFIPPGSLCRCSGSPEMIGLAATPEVSLADEPVRIRAWGLPPQTAITLRAWVRDEKGDIFHSRAFYQTDAEGKVDLEQSEATGGDFHGIYPMGLFWALKPTTPYRRLIKRDVMGSPFLVHLELYPSVLLVPSEDHLPAVTTVVERWYVAPGVQRLQVRDGRVRGALFLPPGAGPFPGVIDMFGMIGGLVEFRSSLLASRGFASLALAYFAYEDLPKFMPTMDLAYFEEAAQFLLRNPKVSGNGVGVVGVCKGAEIALCMASYLPQVQATVCINGTNAVNGNFLTYGNISMGAIPYQIHKVQLYSETMQFSSTLEDPMKLGCQDSVIPIERARGPVLFCVGDKDQNCESLFFANEALARARKKGKQNVYVRRYPGAGHLLEPPGSPFCPVSQSPIFPLPVIWGGELVPHCTAQETCWREMRDFLHSNLAPSTKSKL
eukprot:XP_017946338.1 PREDICTED: bile acid-CoA:amino acid N-acyltransferase-like [Xenopus tropicalis]